MKSFLLLLLLSPLVTFAQTDSLLYGVLPMQDGKVTYTKIIEVKGTDKAQLLSKIKQWAVRAYGSQKTALETEDKENGLIVYKGYINSVGYYSGGIFKGKPFNIRIYHTLELFAKDEKVKILMTDIETLGEDFTSVYVSNRTGSLIDKVRIESWGDELNKRIKQGTISNRKEAKWRASLKQRSELTNSQIESLLNNISSQIQNTKSEFDF